MIVSPNEWLRLPTEEACSSCQNRHGPKGILIGAGFVAGSLVLWVAVHIVDVGY